MKITTHQFSTLLAILPFILFSKSAFSLGIQTTIEKIDPTKWTVEYSASKPIERVAFKRNPDDSRTTRWRPLDEDFRVFFIEGEEFIARKDGLPFTEVKLYLTPNYKHLAKDYAPFSPFSDGGTLFHTGRFFACENQCDDEFNQWNFKLAIPSNEHIIIKGQKVGAETTWIDSDSGMNIYVGKQSPLEANGFVAVIDKGLPNSIKFALETDIPRITAYFSSKMGELPNGPKPMLFASYSKTKGTSVQGGVLPNQIFIHWDKDDLDIFAEDEVFINDLLWTFAHEVGHYYQRFNSTNISSSESWVHEGHAELLAYDALTSLYPAAEEYLKTKVTNFEHSCSKDLESTSLKNAAVNGKFQAYYTCGFLIHHRVAGDNQNNSGISANPYVTWKLFSSKNEAGSRSAQEAFLDSIAELTSEELATAIRRFIISEHLDANESVDTLIRSQ